MPVSYRSVLISRSIAAAGIADDVGPLTHLEVRNRDALRAWRERATHPVVEPAANPRRAWLASFGWADSAAGLGLTARPPALPRRR